MPASSKAPFASKEVPKESIIVSESLESNSEEGTRSPTLSVSPIRAVGDIVIGGRAAKHARTSKPVEVGPSPLIVKGKKVVENLTFAPNNELLNAAEVGADSTPASKTEMLHSRMFGGVLDASDPHLLTLVSHLAYATK